MGMSIVSNIASLNAQRNLGKTSNAMTGNIGRLSSGLRINKAGDDAAGLAISENLRAQTRSLAMAERNAMDGISLLQTAEGAMNEVNGILGRMRELAVQASGDTVGTKERGYLNQEYTALVSEIDRIANTTEFNGTKLTDGSFATTGMDLQIGMRNTTDDRLSVQVGNMTSGTSGLAVATALDSKTAAQAAIATIDTAIDSTVSNRADLGAVQNRLGIAISNLGSMRENLSAADSRIRDVDMAEETAAMTRNSILMQSGVAVLAQANQQPSMALSLIG